MFKNENINLVKNDAEQFDFSKLAQNTPIEYYINNDENQVLKVYIFSSKDERAKARTEYNNKTATMNMAYGEIYEAKRDLINKI